jgi:hypothetical protein
MAEISLRGVIGCCLLFAGCGGGAPSTAADLRISMSSSSKANYIGCFRDYDPDGQHTFANTVMYKEGAPIQRAAAKYGMQGFISLEDLGTIWKYLDPMNPRNESGLHPGWAAVLTSAIDTAGPLLRNGTVLGLFLGDD